MALHNDLGKLGEQKAAELLQSKGYKILERDWHWQHKDVDIIAEKDEVLVFVEVKTRSTSFKSPLESIDKTKVKNILMVADTYVNKIDYSGNIRFDIITLVGTPKQFVIEHIEDVITVSDYQ